MPIAGVGFSFYICNMDTTKRIIEEAESLMDFLYDDVETLFLPDDVLQNIDFDDDIQDAVSDFLMDYKED